MHTFGLILVALNGLTAVGFGVFGLATPTGTAETVSLEPQNAFGSSEIRAIYGGHWLAIGLILLASVRHLAASPRGKHAERIRTIGLCWIGLPLGRGLGLALEGGEGGPAFLFLLGEVAMIVTLLVGLRLAQR